MTTRGGWRISAGVLMVAAMTMGSAVEAAAQTRRGSRDSAAPRGWVDLNIIGADPVGEFGELVDGGIGANVGGRLAIDRIGAVSLRLDGGFMVYGHERESLCFPPPIGCRIGADLTTTNHIAYLGVGPEFSLPGAVSPYVFGTVGFSYFGTSSSLSGLDDDENLFETRHYSDWVTATRFGGGIRARVGATNSGPVAIDVGVEYHRNGVAEYLREGDILDHPDGSITLFPNRTEANMMVLRVGVSFGFGGGNDDRRDDPPRRGRGR